MREYLIAWQDTDYYVFTNICSGENMKEAIENLKQTIKIPPLWFKGIIAITELDGSIHSNCL